MINNIKIRDYVGISNANKYEELSKENPIKTRQSELLKMFPNVEIDEEGVAIICPAKIDTNFKCRVNNAKCSQCCKDYWSEKIE